MPIEQVDVYRYQLPLAQPLTFGEHTTSKRAGLLIRLADEQGNEGWGDVAPLPHFSTETLAEAEEVALALGRTLLEAPLPDTWSRTGDWLRQETSGATRPSSVRCGIDLAVWSLLADRRQVSLPKLLSSHPQATVALNALLTPSENLQERITQLEQQGYRALKLKVGRQPVEADIDRVRLVADSVGASMRLRLDANRAWTWNQATAFAEATEDIALEYVEEPLADPGRLPALVDAYDMPIALDETTRTMDPDDLSAHGYAEAIILKPMLIGGLERGWQFAQRATDQGIAPVVSSSFESGIGLRGLIALAAALATGTPSGLDTYRYFTDDVLQAQLPFAPPNVDVQALMDIDIELDRSVAHPVSQAPLRDGS